MKIPSHLYERFAWYSPHLAWLRHAGFNTEHEPLPGDAPQRANLAGADLTGVNLTGANLTGANLTGASLAGANLRGADLALADLTDASLRGANLALANLRGANLRGAYLTGANLTGANLRGSPLMFANLADANLADANLADANLTGASLRRADLRGADLEYANLMGASLTGASLAGANLPFDAEIPTIENIDRRILDAVTAAGCSLDMSRWHTCATTPFRAGWAIHLAGEPGRRLEQRFGSGVAGSLIYAKSRPEKPIPDFYASNEDAMADIVKCAAEGGAA